MDLVYIHSDMLKKQDEERERWKGQCVMQK